MKILARVGRLLIKNKSVIFVGIGCIGTAVAGAVACKETLTVEETLDECIEEIEAAEDGKKKAYLYAVKHLGRHYAPAIFIEVMSIVSILYGYHVLSSRHAALIAGYNSLNASYKKYREYVRIKYGDEEDAVIANGFKKLPAKEQEGEEKKENLWANEIYPRKLSVTGRFFGPESINGSDNPEENLVFLKGMEEEANALFDDQGYLFLNDVYSLIGAEPSQMGSMMGWVKGLGDDFIDFHIIDVRNFHAVNGETAEFFLEFNHDGYILDKV